MSVWHRNKLRFASLEWCWWNHRKMTTEKGEGREENLSTALLSWQQILWAQYLPLPTHSLSVNLFTCITQTFRCSQRPKFMYFWSFQKLPESNYFCLHFPFPISFLTLLGSAVTFRGLYTQYSIFSGSIVLPVWSQRSLSLATALSLSLSPSSFVQRVCNQLPVLTVDTSKKYDFNFSKKIWIMQCSPHRQYPPLLASCTI